MNAGKPILFRSYPVPKNASFDCTIWEAARATSAVPKVFKSIVIGGPGSRQPYIGGEIGFSNPTEHVLQEAELIFPGRCFACIISIGTELINIPKPSPFERGVVPSNVVEVMANIITDCKMISEAMSLRFKSYPGIYFRFNVEQGTQSNKLADLDSDSVNAHTSQYLKMYKVDQDLDLAATSLTAGFATPMQII